MVPSDEAAADSGSARITRLAPRLSPTRSSTAPPATITPVASAAPNPTLTAAIPIPAPVARWLGRIKAAAARVNGELGLLDADKAERIAAAADRIADGELDDQFPIDVFQTGSGTSSNMNANEVIANLAGEDVHANDDVNMGQSSNDVFPTAVHLAFRASSKKVVDAFYKAAIAAGATDNGPPGPRPKYFAAYYAAYVLDLDGYNIEAVFQ